MKRVFIVGRLPEMNEGLPAALRSEGWEVMEISTGGEALRLLRGEEKCGVLLAGRPDEISGRGLLKNLGRRFPDVPGILLLPEREKKSLLGERFLDLSGRTNRAVAEVMRGLNAAERPGEPPVRLLGRGKGIEQVRRTIEQVAPTSMTVLITGESGTGKDVVAKLIHAKSGRSGKPLIAVNCAALPEGVLESELFGHERGAFTGATSRREGRFELAHEGTLFLDEIGDIPVRLQAKLLRVLEEKRFLRVGGVKDVVANVRLVAATNADLDAAVQEGRFREDLYYRLNVIQIQLPPLRERREDIPILVEAFIADAGADHGLEKIRFTAEALDYLVSYHWPGNVRQLRNLIEKIAILEAGGTIGLAEITAFLGERFSRSRNLPVVASARSIESERELIYQTLLAIRADLADVKETLRRGSPWRSEYATGRASRFGSDAEVVELDERDSPEGRKTAADYEREAIRRALRESDGNRRRAAEILEIGERTLYRKLKKYGLD